MALNGTLAARARSSCIAALLFACAAATACVEEGNSPAPGGGDDEGRDVSGARDDASAPSNGGDSDSKPNEPGGSADGDVDASGPDSPGSEVPGDDDDDDGDDKGPKPLIDAGTPDLGDDGGVPFDPIPSTPDAGAPREDLGVGDGKDVVTIGDSWMDMFTNGGGIEGALRRAGKKYRNYAVPGTTLAGQIPGQYTSAKRSNPDIKTVIMTGGGNDVMFTGACNSSASACESAGAAIVKRLNTLWTEMANDGVKDVVYIQYSDSAGTARMRPEDDARPVVEICTTGKIRCHSIPTTDLVTRRDLVDGIHPTRAANDKIAKRVLELMEMRGVRR